MNQTSKGRALQDTRSNQNSALLDLKHMRGFSSCSSTRSSNNTDSTAGGDIASSSSSSDTGSIDGNPTSLQVGHHTCYPQLIANKHTLQVHCCVCIIVHWPLHSDDSNQRCTIWLAGPNCVPFPPVLNKYSTKQLKQWWMAKGLPALRVHPGLLAGSLGCLGDPHECFTGPCARSPLVGDATLVVADMSTCNFPPPLPKNCTHGVCMQASMDKLVDTAVNLVEEGRLQQAVEVLQQGITLLTSAFPGRYAANTRAILPLQHIHSSYLALAAHPGRSIHLTATCMYVLLKLHLA